MALTQGAWTKKEAPAGYNVWECTVLDTASENDSYTLKTPAELDGTKPWHMAMSASQTIDGSAIPLDLWLGYTDDFAISGDGSTVTAGSNGYKLKAICDDAVLAVTTLKYSFMFDPNLPVADVDLVANILDGFKIRVPAAPYYAFNLNGASTLAGATTVTWTIYQGPSDGGNTGLVSANITRPDPS